jgi:CDP-diacylglycerol--serine O-phosphatidyltransferase
MNTEIVKKDLKKGMYVLPSLFTCGNITFGVLSMFSSISGKFIPAAWFLVCSLVCDILDGRIARLTKTTSEFGFHLDSLSDFLSFGAAPAVLMYMLILKTMHKVGVAIAVLFVLCSALRLARFNVMARSGGARKYFIGLPTPASAGIIVSFVLSYELLGPSQTALNFKTIPILIQTMPYFFKFMPIVMIALSFLMVSNVPYPAFKNLNLSKPRTLQLLVLLIVLVLLILVFPQNTFFVIFSVYVLSGLIMYVPRLLMKRRQKKNGEETGEI